MNRQTVSSAAKVLEMHKEILVVVERAEKEKAKKKEKADGKEKK